MRNPEHKATLDLEHHSSQNPNSSSVCRSVHRFRGAVAAPPLNGRRRRALSGRAFTPHGSRVARTTQARSFPLLSPSRWPARRRSRRCSTLNTALWRMLDTKKTTTPTMPSRPRSRLGIMKLDWTTSHQLAVAEGLREVPRRRERARPARTR